jgi:secreted trypsin-like serine protease
VQVKNPVNGTSIAPATDPAALVAGTKVWVSGWGATDRKGASETDVLQGVWLDYITTSACNGTRSYRGAVTDNMFCAGIGGVGGMDSCHGDSGGPASIGGETNPQLIGLVSWGGEECGLPYQYGVYTKVLNFLTWVKDTSQSEVKW